MFYALGQKSARIAIKKISHPRASVMVQSRLEYKASLLSMAINATSQVA